MGTKRTDYIALASAHKPSDPYLWDESRGNCPAHAQFDVCKVLPNVEYFTAPGGAEINAPKACPLLRDWQNSPAATEWELNPETQISSDVTSFLRGMLNAIDCENFSIWTKCHDMEEKQNHLVVRDEFSDFKPDIPDVDTDSSKPPETTDDDDEDTDASAEEENEDKDEDEDDEDKDDEDKDDEGEDDEDKDDEDEDDEDKNDEDKNDEDKGDGDTDNGDKDYGEKGDDENDDDDDKESDKDDFEKDTDDNKKETDEDDSANDSDDDDSDGKRPSDSESAAIGDDGSQDEDNDDSESSTVSGSSGTCFPGSSLAELQSGEMVRMEKLRIGDSVRVSKDEFSQIFMFTHRVAYPRQEFVEIHVGNRTLRATEGHIVYANDMAVAAEKVRVGDVMKTVDGEGVVRKVSRAMDRGLYNPQTLHGDIVVDGVSVSTYTMAVDRMTATALMAPIRGLFRRGWIGERFAGGWFREGSRSVMPM